MRLLPLFLWLLSLPLLAQYTAEPRFPEVRTADGTPLRTPWAGGANAPQPLPCDLDGDGRQDIVLFDRVGDVLTGLLGDGNGNYRQAPRRLLAGFPDDLNNWVVLRDFNGDGIQDIFSYALELDGIRVFRGSRNADGTLSFTPLRTDPTLPVIYYRREDDVRSVLFVSNIDYPAIDDVDGDGDLDVLTFNVAGGYVEFYRNVTAEEGLTDTIAYVLEEECWGGFFESGISPTLDLADSPGDCVNALQNPDGGPVIDFRHSGSTLLALDYDGNGLTDLMLGDVSFSGIVLALNGGTAERAWINEQDDRWRAGGKVVDLPSFPGMYQLDVDGDGRRDLLAAPHQTLNAEDVTSLWLYQNTGSDYVFRDSQYLLREMIDVGTSAGPTFFDYDGDGDLDLLVGNDENYSRSNFINSFVTVYENLSGPDEEPVFQLAETDYLNLTQFRNTAWNFAPAFGDMDGDGDADVVIGTNTGKLFYGENTAGPGAVPEFPFLAFDWMGLDAGQFAKPHIADLDRDGRPDLLVGGFDGRIRFYHNIGTPTEPMFNPVLAESGNQLQLGGIDARVSTSTGHPVPWVLQNAEQTLVLTGTREGRIEAYRLPVGTDYTEDFELVTENFGGVNDGIFGHPAFADLDGDGQLELVNGNRRGGVAFYSTNLTMGGTVGVNDRLARDLDVEVFPNPATDVLNVILGAGARVQSLQLYDLLGRSVAETVDSHQLSVSELASGVYVLRVELGDGRFGVRRVVVR